MNTTQKLLILGLALSASACSSNLTCEEPQLYEAARETEPRIGLRRRRISTSCRPVERNTDPESLASRSVARRGAPCHRFAANP